MSWNIHCNLMSLVETPTKVTWELMAAAKPGHPQDICEANGRYALNVLEAYVEWRIQDLKKLDGPEWFTQSWAVGNLTVKMLEDAKKDSPSAFYTEALLDGLEYCRKNVDSLEVRVV